MYKTITCNECYYYDFKPILPLGKGFLNLMNNVILRLPMSRFKSSKHYSMTNVHFKFCVFLPKRFEAMSVSVCNPFSGLG